MRMLFFQERSGVIVIRVSESARRISAVWPALEKLMAREIIRTPNAPSPPPTYSQAVRAAGLVFVSGTGPHDPVTGKIVGDSIQEQTRQCLQNVSAILQAAGTSLDRIVSATVILLEERDFAGMNEEWMKWFPVNPPARQGAKLPVRRVAPVSVICPNPDEGATGPSQLGTGDDSTMMWF